MLDAVAAITDTFAEVQDSIFVEEAFSLLTPKQQKVIRTTVLAETTEREVANEMGVSKQAVNRIKERALKRLRKKLVLDEPTGK